MKKKTLHVLPVPLPCGRHQGKIPLALGQLKTVAPRPINYVSQKPPCFSNVRRPFFSVSYQDLDAACPHRVKSASSVTLGRHVCHAPRFPCSRSQCSISTFEQKCFANWAPCHSVVSQPRWPPTLLAHAACVLLRQASMHLLCYDLTFSSTQRRSKLERPNIVSSTSGRR